MTTSDDHRPILRHWGQDATGPVITQQGPFRGRVFSCVDEALATFYGGSIEPTDWLPLIHSSFALFFWQEEDRDSAGIALFAMDAEHPRGFRFIKVTEPKSYHVELIASDEQNSGP